MVMSTLIKAGNIERRIWGHRLYDEQTGLMTFLEFLCVLASLPFEQQNADRSINEETLKLQEYKIPKRAVLRTLIFNNPYIDEVYASNEDPWELWFESFSKDSQNEMFDINGACKSLELKALLQHLFDEGGSLTKRQSFECFAGVIRMLRFAGINAESEKRWTSRFVFPWGRHCLFSDLNHKGKTDRRFFARNGELAFLLLSFAERREELAELIRDKIFDSGHVLDRLCEALQTDLEYIRVPRAARLPTEFGNVEIRRANILCEDLIRLFELPIPAPDIVAFAARTMTLNLFVYFMECGYKTLARAGAEMPSDRNVFLCEVIQKESSDIRRMSKALSPPHTKQSTDAAVAYFQLIQSQAVRVIAPNDGEGVEDDAASYSDAESDTDYGDDDTPPGMISTPEEARAAHSKHWASIHRVLSRDCGLGSKLNTNAYRYAPSDELLETLVATMLPGKRMLLNAFLRCAYDRYVLIFGEAEFNAANIKDRELELDSAELQKNRRRLQNRIDGLGLLVSLSDGSEYVMNPYRA